jgi:hypothetical protein
MEQRRVKQRDGARETQVRCRNVAGRSHQHKTDNRENGLQIKGFHVKRSIGVSCPGCFTWNGYDLSTGYAHMTCWAFHVKRDDKA